MFDIEELPGFEVFDSALLVLDTEKDLNPGMEQSAGSVPIPRQIQAVARAELGRPFHTRKTSTN